MLAGAQLGGCQLGRPPVSSFSPGPVEAAAVEPGLPDALRQSLGAALSRRGALAARGTPVKLVVLSAQNRTLAPGADRQVHEVALAVQVVAAGPSPREVVLRGARSYTIPTTGPRDAAQARAAATVALCEELMDDAVEWLLFAPEVR